MQGNTHLHSRYPFHTSEVYHGRSTAGIHNAWAQCLHARVDTNQGLHHPPERDVLG